MNISIAIVGLPNAGKSTLFNALLRKQQALAANYPFATIEPNTGIVPVPDERLNVLAKIVHTEKIVPALVEFVDVAGLVKGAHSGEGLGNKFLSHIRETSAIVYVLRFFEDPDVIHVANKVDPAEDLATLNEELLLSDLQTLDNMKEPKQNASKEQKEAYELAQLLKKHLDTGIPAREFELDIEQKQLVKQFNLLTMKPAIYVANMSEEQLQNKDAVLAEWSRIAHPGSQIITLSAKLESELSEATDEERKELLSSVGITESALDQLARVGYETLNLISFLTAGEIEARAWTILKGAKAPQAAAVIHTDFEKKFIKADIVSYKDFVAENGWVGSRAKGLARSEGKEYVMQEGDIVEFKIGA
ncbi:MAG: redox-regulated ATPase YchF [Patescibacteria group bacterium]|jgi:hypothetical protein